MRRALELAVAAVGRAPLRRGFRTHSCHAVMVSGARRDVFTISSRRDFERLVVRSDRPVLIDFHARWCEPCKKLNPRLEAALAPFNNSVHLAKVDIDVNDDLAAEYQVGAIPVVLGFKNGKVMDKFIGLHKDERITNFVRKLLQA